jgi:hypothetical protein
MPGRDGYTIRSAAYDLRKLAYGADGARTARPGRGLEAQAFGEQRADLAAAEPDNDSHLGG